MYAGRIYMVEIDETVVCKFLYIMNFSHIIENLPFLHESTVKYYTVCSPV